MTTESSRPQKRIEILPSDQALVIKADNVLSIVPLQNTVDSAPNSTCMHTSTGNLREAIEDVGNQPKRSKLHYLELNAVPAQLASAQSDEPTTATGRGRGCHFLDGGIIWGPPPSTQDCSWKKPSVVSRRLVSAWIGAFTLKLSFSALTNGLTAQMESMLPGLLALEEYSSRTAPLAMNG
ncbi:hypothetical protein N7530_001965 [Penicillium desertorum]|uniref:Uncharacterized protein n=1 Tax=Penicillium desertorum TaxID=1303715 RepID=A0A9X0BXD8_9EURO|nr:hypothetical protein N7530_001965 [Penicillium desertorum]